MKPLARSLPLALATLALGTFGAVTAAHARTDVYLSLGVPAQTYVQSQPVYVQHGYGYTQPGYGYQHPGYGYQRGYVQSQPVYVQQPGYVQHRPGHGYGRHQERRYGPWGDLDRDGIPNQHDRDRDGDGVRNRFDREPDNGYRY